MYKNAFKKLPFVILYVLDQHKGQEMWNKFILENGGMLKVYFWLLQEWKKCDKSVSNYAHTLEFVPNSCKSEKMCNETVDTYPSAIQFIPAQYKVHTKCVIKLLLLVLLYLIMFLIDILMK